eukprot:8281484-Ditylum_brightwellii.AAC.1
MEDVYEKEEKARGVMPDVMSYNILMDTFSKNKEEQPYAAASYHPDQQCTLHHTMQVGVGGTDPI